MTFRQQHLKSGYILDFYYPQSCLAVEVNGGYHNNEDQRKYDATRDRRLAEAKVTTLRFTNEEVESDVTAVGNKIREEVLRLNGLV